MRRTTVFLEEGLDKELKTVAYRQQRPVASVVREALVAYVAQAQAVMTRLPSFVASGRSGERDTAEHHEELLFAELRPHSEVSAPRTAKRASKRRARRVS